MEPSPGADPGLPPYRGGVTAVCDGNVPSARLERALVRALALVPLPLAYRPQCAAKVSNLVPRGKGPVHHQSCLQRFQPGFNRLLYHMS
jgi:hypothetical protein